MQKKDLEYKNIKKYLWDLGDYQKKQVFRWQANVGTTNSAAPQNAPTKKRNSTGDRNVGFKTPQAHGQHNQPQQTAMHTTKDQPLSHYSEREPENFQGPPHNTRRPYYSQYDNRGYNNNGGRPPYHGHPQNHGN